MSESAAQQIGSTATIGQGHRHMNVQLADCKVHRHVLWTDEEDSKLRELVQTHGAKDWRGISLKMGVERDGKSCRQRWLNHLATGVNREPFSRDEDAKIIALQREFGNKWSKIAHALGSKLVGQCCEESLEHRA